jgi:hypothetical protein
VPVHWDPDPPDVDDAEQAMIAVAAKQVDEPRARNPNVTVSNTRYHQETKARSTG